MRFFLILFMSWASSAYIPEYSLITSRAADQHGKGSYLIEQDVTFHREGESQTVRETWLVTGENTMRVTLEGRGALKGLVQGSLLYEGGQKFFVEPAGSSVRAQRLGDEWLEPLFHFRSGKYLRNRLVSLKVAPAESLHDRAPLDAENDPKYEPPGYLRLSRVGGSMAWAVSTPPEAGNRPTLWIEQDQFVVRKYRGANQIVIKAGDYGKFDEGLWFPRHRTYIFGTYTVEVQALVVKALGKLKPDDARFKASNLTATRDGLKLPETEALKEFYSRFR